MNTAKGFSMNKAITAQARASIDEPLWLHKVITFRTHREARTTYADLNSLSLAVAYDLTELAKDAMVTVSYRGKNYNCVDFKALLELATEAPDSAFRLKTWARSISLLGMKSCISSSGVFTNPVTGQKTQMVRMPDGEWAMTAESMALMLGVPVDEIESTLAIIEEKEGR
jgi:hypothetical protein